MYDYSRLTILLYQFWYITCHTFIFLHKYNQDYVSTAIHSNNCFGFVPEQYGCHFQSHSGTLKALWHSPSNNLIGCLWLYELQITLTWCCLRVCRMYSTLLEMLLVTSFTDSLLFLKLTETVARSAGHDTSALPVTWTSRALFWVRWTVTVCPPIPGSFSSR